MNWKVNYSSQSKVDLDSVYEYIAFTLFSPEAARRKVKRITEAIGLLKTFPFMYKLYEEEPWKSKGLRVFNVSDFFIFYMIDEEARTIYIARIIYGGRNIEKQLERSDDF